MEYIIEGKVIFRLNENVLMNKDDHEQKITLTLTASRLLNVLISHSGDVLTRDVLFRQVWEDYGIDASNNSLNQYISVLRGVFRTLEISGDLIITVPRIGFMLNPDVAIEYSEDSLLLPMCETHLGTEQAIKSDKKYFLKSIRGKLISLSVLMFIASMASPALIKCVFSKSKVYDLNLVSLGKLQECRIYTIPMYDHDRNLPSQELTESIIKTTGIKCPVDGKLYIHVDGNVVNGDKGKVWVSSCESQKKDGALRCRNYLVNDWRLLS